MQARGPLMTDQEDQAMLAEFYAFDRKMIHEKYETLVGNFEKQTS